MNTSSSRHAKRRRSKPLDSTSLRDLALSYVGRFATTGAKLEAYLARKIRERGVAEDPDGRMVELDVSGLVEQFVERGYVDDDAYARSKSRDLSSRGYGARRVEQALWAAGVDQQLRESNAPSLAERRRSAIVMATKRRFGPFGLHDDQERLDTAVREKQIAAMLRAGHDMDLVRFILHSDSIDDVEQWLSEAEQEERESGEGPGW
jgi:regulatory protein